MNSKFLFYLLAFLEGAAVMSVELSGARIIAPVYGSSFHVWSIVLAVVVGYLAIGYFLGGVFSQRRQTDNLLFNLLIMGATLICVLPFSADMLYEYFRNDTPNVFSLVVFSLIVLSPPAILLGATTPLIISVLSMKDDPGKVSGKVFAISTAGGITSTFLTGFYFIPDKGISFTLLVIGALLGLVPAIILLIKKSYLMPALFSSALVIYSLQEMTHSDEHVIRVLHKEEGIMGQLMVADLRQTDRPETRAMFVNRMGQTWEFKNTSASAWSYVNYVLVASSVLPESPEVLILGLGGGTVAKQLIGPLKASVDAVEFDERIARISKTYFNLPSEVNVYIDDARHYVINATKKYDLVIYDVFKGEAPPSHAFTIEALQEVKKILKKDGLVIINFNGFIHGDEGLPGRSVFATLNEAGFKVNILPTFEETSTRNILYLASLEEKDYSKTKFMLTLNNASVSLDKLFLNPHEILNEQAFVLVDDKPVLEQMNYLASQKWRADYYKNYTTLFSSHGVKVFD